MRSNIVLCILISVARTLSALESVEVSDVFWVDPEPEVYGVAQVTIDALSYINYSKYNISSCAAPSFVVWKEPTQPLSASMNVTGANTPRLGIVKLPTCCQMVLRCFIRQICTVDGYSQEFTFSIYTFTVNEREKPSAVIQPQGNLAVDLGTTVELRCSGQVGTHTEASTQISEYMWTVNGNLVSQQGALLQLLVRESTTVRCSARQSPGHLLASSSELKITVANHPTIHFYDKVVYADLNGTATLTCEATPGRNNSRVTYQWLQDGAPLSDGAKYSGSQTNKLSIFQVTSADKLRFQCKVQQSNSSLSTESPCCSEVLLIEPPRITLQPRNVIARRGSPTTMRCDAQSGKNSLGINRFQWLKDGVEISEKDTISASGFRTQNLTWTDVHSRDAGVYTCVVYQNRGDLVAVSDTATLKLKSEKLTSIIILSSVGGSIVGVILVVMYLDRAHTMPIASMKVRKALRQIVAKTRMRSFGGEGDSDSSCEDNVQLTSPQAKAKSCAVEVK